MNFIVKPLTEIPQATGACQNSLGESDKKFHVPDKANYVVGDQPAGGLVPLNVSKGSGSPFAVFSGAV